MRIFCNCRFATIRALFTLAHWHIILILLFTTGLVRAQDSVAYTSPSRLELRIPGEGRMEEFRKDKDFQYESSQPFRYPTWLQRLIGSITEFLGESASIILSRELALILLVLIVSTIIIMIALKTQNISLKTLFGKQKLESEDAEFVAEDVNKMNFDQLIAESMKAGNYRLAIRFLYLKNLKSLSDREFIKWNPNKTNYSYQYEIESARLRTKFLDTTLIFDFVWYGEFVLDENRFREAYHFFQEFNQMIGNER
ncbi:hypothetical protein [Viscerimonas tarda]